MTRIRVRGFKIFNDRHGKPRCYHRKTGHKVDLEKAPLGSAEFFARCEKITAISEAMEARDPKRGTLGFLIETYRGTEHFRDLAPRTKGDYQTCFDWLKPLHATPVHIIDTPAISKIHDRAAKRLGWRRANMVRTALSEVFRWNIPKGNIDKNYATDVPAKRRPKDAPRANRPWSAAEKVAVLKSASPYLGAVVALMFNTGLDPSDAIRLRRTDIAGGVIRGLRGKTGEPVAIPILEDLRAALDAVPDHSAITVLASSKGTPWTYDGLSSSWHRLKRKLEKDSVVDPGLTLKGIRHSVATILREDGVDPRDIADLLGQKTESMALHYSDTAKLETKNRATVAKLQKESRKRTKSVKP